MLTCVYVDTHTRAYIYIHTHLCEYSDCLALALALAARALVAGRHGHEGAGRVLD